MIIFINIVINLKILIPYLNPNLNPKLNNMRCLYLLGVTNKHSNNYENILDAEKINKYKCIACDSDLILRKGEKNFQSFIHKNKNGCQYFKNPTQEQLINDALLHLKQLLLADKVSIFRRCKICKMNIKMNLIDFDNININGNELLCLKNNETVQRFKINSSELHENSDYMCYQINILKLIKEITISFATKKVELLCREPITCSECQIKYAHLINE